MQKFRPLLIIGPSGVGKDTLVTMLKKDYPHLFQKAITHTTRKPRSYEIDGIHYYFTSPEKLEEEFLQGKFIEKAEIHGHFYGTSFKSVNDVIDQGKICLLEIDVNGAESLKRENFNPCCIFILPPSIDELKNRIKKRGEETEEKINLRIQTAKNELLWASFSNFLDYKIVNDDLNKCYGELKNAINNFYNLQL